MRTILSPVLPWALLLAVIPGCSGNRQTDESDSAGLPDLIPRAVLNGEEGRGEAQLSPDGTRYAYVAPVDGVMNIWMAQLGETEGQPVTRNQTRGIFWYFWAPDGKSVLYLSDRDGDENWALYACDVESGEVRAVTPSADVQVNVLAVETAHPDRILIEMNDRNPLAHDVHRLDLATGKTELVATNPGNVRFWITDPQLRVRGMHLSNQDGSFDFMVRDDEAGEWRNAAHWELEDAITSRPVGFSVDGTSAYLLDSRGTDTGRLVELNLATGDMAVLAEDPDYDLGDVFGVDLMRHPETAALQAVSYLKEHKTYLALDPAMQRDFDRLAKAHPGDFDITSRSADDSVWFIRYERDTASGAYYAYDRATGKTTLLFESQPDLNQYTLAKCEPIRFTARDGLPMQGYITFPPGVPREGLPMVVNPHGGPWWRDTWGYNPETQWMANRGYIVLNVNFRGSTSYGKTHINRADHEWGRAMLHDLVDGVDWAVEQGYADPERVGIFGWSFGGYQSLCAATFAGDRFACAIDGVGPSNLITFMNAFPPQWETRKPRFYLRGGHPDRDQDLLVERSPYHHAERITTPILIVQGANDPRVKQAESDQIVAKLEELGVEHKYMLFEDEGHGLYRPENVETFYAEAEAFLAKHLGGRVEPPAAEPTP